MSQEKSTLVRCRVRRVCVECVIVLSGRDYGVVRIEG